VIDTHCHLSHPDFDPDRDEVIARSWREGVTAILEVGYSVTTSRSAISISNANHERIRASVGIHPHEAGTATDADFQAMESLLAAPNVIAIGETGLDFYRDWAPRENQIALFAKTVNLARERHLPLVIHDREAHDDVLRILETDGRGEVRGIFHCFSGDDEVARRAMDLGFYLGMGGSITYVNPRKKKGRMLAELPLDKMVLETDAPWLSPEPEKGTRNEPARMRHVVKRLAEVQERSEAEIVRATSENVARLFAHAAPWPPRDPSAG
jgi:TatD DNase family protein